LVGGVGYSRGVDGKGGGMEGERMIECGIIRWWSCSLVIKLQKNSQKRSPKKVVLGSPGRGVLRHF